MSGVTLHCPHCMADVPKRMSVSVPGLILIDRYVCPVCGWMTLREELVEETKLNILRSGRIPPPPPPPLELEWITESAVGVGASMTIPNVSITGTESLYFVYLDDFPDEIPFTRTITATWNGEQVGASPWTVDSAVRAASLDQDGFAVLWVVRHQPITPGTGSLIINETSSVPTNRLASVFRVKNGGAFLDGAEGETETAFTPPTELGELSDTRVDMWTAVVGFRSAMFPGEWTGANRVHQSTSNELLLDVASSPNRIPFGAFYDTHESIQNAGALLGYQDNQ